MIQILYVWSFYIANLSKYPQNVKRKFKSSILKDILGAADTTASEDRNLLTAEKQISSNRSSISRIQDEDEIKMPS